jgi:FkbM family methyltransferase
LNLFPAPDIEAELYLRDNKEFLGNDLHYEQEEVQLIRELVKPNDLCFDIGANIGYFTILLAKISRYVYAFEPEPENFRLLIKNIAHNKLEQKTYPLMTAVGLTTELGDLYKCSTNHGMHRMYESKWCEKTPIPVSVIALDQEFRGLLPNFVKIDTEGYELQVIMGMSKMLIKAQPKILMEFHPLSLMEQGGDDTPECLFNLLVYLGYNIYLAPDINNKLNYATLHYRTNDSMGGQNIVCIPSRS